MKTIIGVLLCLLLATAAHCTGLDFCDLATVYHVQVSGERGVIRSDTFGTYVGFRGWNADWSAQYDTLYEIVATFERPIGPTAFAWNEITFADWVQDIYLSLPQDTNSLGQVFQMFGPKQNQGSAAVDVWEAGRRMATNDYWTIITYSFFPPQDQWTRYYRRVYTSARFASVFRLLVTTDFRYLTVHFQPAFCADTVRLRMTDTPDCQYSMWSPQTYGVDFFPNEDEPYCVQPTFDEGVLVYQISLDSLGLPPGDYSVDVLSTTGAVIRHEEVGSIVKSSVFGLTLSLAELRQSPDCAQFTVGSVRRMAVLEPFEFVGPWRW